MAEELTTTAEATQPSFAARVKEAFSNQWQHVLDSSTPYLTLRWMFLVLLLALFGLRIHLVQGFFIVTYGLAIFMLNMFIGFLSPLEDPDVGGHPLLPTSDRDEFKPFVRRLPEFKFWLACVKGVCVAFCMTFFSMFDVPVFWPILLIYFIILFVLTMKRQIRHMVRHKYVPFSRGKRKYGAD